MWLMWVVGGVSLALLIFLMIKRKMKNAEITKRLEHISLVCSKCQVRYDAAPAYVRTRLLGGDYVFKCPRGHRNFINPAELPKIEA